MKKRFVILLDAGHGKDTPGKRSPEGMLAKKGKVAIMEYDYNRKIRQALCEKLAEAEIEFISINTEANDVSLHERVRRINRYATNTLKGEYLLISIHLNAAPKPNMGSGWEAYTSPGQTKADELADYFYKRVEELAKVKGNEVFRQRTDYTDGDADKEANFTLLARTVCPAVLTENLFMDTESNLEWLLKEDSVNILAQLHFDAITDYINANQLPEPKEEKEDSNEETSDIASNDLDVVESDNNNLKEKSEISSDEDDLKQDERQTGSGPANNSSGSSGTKKIKPKPRK